MTGVFRKCRQLVDTPIHICLCSIISATSLWTFLLFSMMEPTTTLRSFLSRLRIVLVKESSIDLMRHLLCTLTVCNQTQSETSKRLTHACLEDVGCTGGGILILLNGWRVWQFTDFTLFLNFGTLCGYSLPRLWDYRDNNLFAPSYILWPLLWWHGFENKFKLIIIYIGV